MVNEEDMDSIESELNIQEIIKGESFDRDIAREEMIRDKKLYDYGLVTFNLKDVESTNAIDEIHTAVMFYTGKVRVLKVSYEDFKQYYQMITNQIINSYVLDSAEYKSNHGTSKSR